MAVNPTRPDHDAMALAWARACDVLAANARLMDNTIAAVLTNFIPVSNTNSGYYSLQKNRRMHTNSFATVLKVNQSLTLSRVLLCLFLIATTLSAQNLRPAGTSTAPPEFRADRILVQPKPGIRAESLAGFHTSTKAKVLATFPELRDLQVVSLPSGETVSAAIAQYQQSGLVEFAEPDYARYLALTPNDPRYADGTLWGLNNYGQGGGTPHADIDAAEAWDVLTSASNIVVATLDTGIRCTHEDLAPNIWTNAVLGGYGWNALAGTTVPADDEGHGSLVAGVLGAVGNNGKGVVGVAWNVKIMACKCFNSQRIGYDSDIVACMEFARTNGARIINASLGAYGSGSLSLSNAIWNAQQVGIIVVAAAGNDGRDIDANPYYPACYGIDNIVTVGFTTRNDTLDSRSNYGATSVDLAAPGASMYSTFFTADNAYLGGSYLYGSSLAAPYVTGTFALMLAKYPAENYQQIIQRVLNAVDPLPSLSGKCVTGGRLNLRKALSPPILLTPLSAAGVVPFQLRVAGGPNRTCVVQTTADLASWTPVYTNTTSAAGTFDFTESEPPSTTQRFYRAVSSP
jgi:subtilisin family serine protease